MDIITFLLFLVWLCCGVLIVRFVLNTGGTKVGKVAHWFGGAFTMFGLAVALVLLYASFSVDFGGKVNAYLLTHLFRDQSAAAKSANVEHAVIPVSLETQNGIAAVSELQNPAASVTVFRHGLASADAFLNDSQLDLSNATNIRTSIWWMLWKNNTSSLISEPTP